MDGIEAVIEAMNEVSETIGAANPRRTGTCFELKDRETGDGVKVYLGHAGTESSGYRQVAEVIRKINGNMLKYHQGIRSYPAGLREARELEKKDSSRFLLRIQDSRLSPETRSLYRSPSSGESFPHEPRGISPGRSI